MVFAGSVLRFSEGRVPQMAGRKAKAYEPRNTLNTRKWDYGIVEMGRVKRVFEKIYFASGMFPGIFSEDALFDKYRIMEIFFAVASRTRTREGKKHVHKPRKLWYNGANRAQIRMTKGKP